MKVINIVDNASKINYGIWNAAISTTKILAEKYQIESDLWYPAIENSLIDRDMNTTALSATHIRYIEQLVERKGLHPSHTIINTHGCWRFPTLWGHRLAQLGFSWVYVPHGMLESWSVFSKMAKKEIVLPFYGKTHGR